MSALVCRRGHRGGASFGRRVDVPDKGLPACDQSRRTPWPASWPVRQPQTCARVATSRTIRRADSGTAAQRAGAGPAIRSVGCRHRSRAVCRQPGAPAFCPAEGWEHRMPQEINSVAVIGGGYMGAGIAEVSAVAGMPVVIRDLPQFLDAARGRVEKSLAGHVRKGRMDEAARDRALARISFTSELKDVASANLVIEAVPEVLDLKLSL